MHEVDGLDLEMIRRWLDDEPRWITVKQSTDSRIDCVVANKDQLQLLLAGGGGILRIDHTGHYSQAQGHPKSPTVGDTFDRYVLTLGGLVDGSIIETDNGWDFRLSTSLYFDGVTRHSVMVAIDQHRKAAAAIELLIEDATAHHKLTEALTSQMAAAKDSRQAEVPVVEEEWIPSVDEVTVTAGTPLVGDNREALGALDSGRWYETLGEARGWIETIGNDDILGWVKADAVTGRRSRPIGPFADAPDQRSSARSPKKTRIAQDHRPSSPSGDQSRSTSRGPARASMQASKQSGKYAVILVEVNRNKRIHIMKALRAITPMDLAASQKLISDLPSDVLRGVDQTTAELAKEALERAGAVVELEG